MTELKKAKSNFIPLQNIAILSGALQRNMTWNLQNLFILPQIATMFSYTVYVLENLSPLKCTGTKKDGNSFRVRLVECNTGDGSTIKRDEQIRPHPINCSISGNTLISKNPSAQLKLHKTDALLDRAFPSSFIKKFLAH